MTYQRGRVVTVPSGAVARCGGRRCTHTLRAGERLTQVLHVARWTRNPGAMDAYAFLCDRCCVRLGAKLGDPEPCEHREPKPFLVRGKEGEPW